MSPAPSILVFTVLAGSAQGLLLALAAAVLSGAAPAPGFLAAALAVAEALLALALGASFLHLGHKRRAWRAILMWRTSWMSREVIVMPALMGAAGAWWASVMLGVDGMATLVLPVLTAALALALWFCTAMIYACLRFVQEWAHPLTIANYTLIGLSSGLVLAGALGVLGGQDAFVRDIAPWALAATLSAGATRALSLRRNAALKPASTLASATGLHGSPVVQRSMGMSAGSFNTREFFHRASPAFYRRIKPGFLLLGFAVPALLLAWNAMSPAHVVWLLAVPIQFIGLLAERWFFFAEARHPQNLYYQAVS